MKILIVYATAGAGHRKAAEAVAQGFKTSNSPHEVVLVDSLDHTYPFFKKSYSGIYTFLITWVPVVWGFFFALLDIPWLRPAVRLGRRIYNSLNAGGFQRYLINENFDVIISTHFLGNEVSGALKKAGKISSRIISVVTDYDVHSIWLSPGIDHYTVATDWTKEKIISLGIPADRVSVTGIPTHESFARPMDKIQLRRKMNMAESQFTVLVATGSFGIGPIEEIITHLKDTTQVAVICGHNKKLYEKLKHLDSRNVRIFGLVNNMDEMMGLADVMITKPGGLSISEAMVCGLPMIFFNAIPGQETNNIRVLGGFGIGLSGISVPEIPGVLKRLQSSPEEYARLKAKIAAVARPQAVNDILSLIN